MAWSEQEPVTSITAPSDPAPGQDYITFGGDLPTELQPFLETAIVMTNGAWTASNPETQMKYYGIGSNSSGGNNYLLFFAYVTNFDSAVGTNKFIIIQQHNIGGTGPGSLTGMFSSFGATTGAGVEIFSSTLATQLVYGGYLEMARYASLLRFSTAGYYAAGWTDFLAGLKPVRMNISADGLVHIEGVAKYTGASVAAGVGTVIPIAILPLAYAVTAPTEQIIVAARTFGGTRRVEIVGTSLQVFLEGDDLPNGAYIALNLSYYAKDFLA